MNKPAKPAADDVDDLSDLYGPPMTDAEMDTWWETNREAISELVQEALDEVAEGKATPWNFEEMLADCEAEFEKSQKG